MAGTENMLALGTPGSDKDHQRHDCDQDDEVRVEQEKDTGVVEAPLAAQAARGFHHSPESSRQCCELPGRAVQAIDVGESGEQQADRECAYREHDGAHQRSFPQAEDVRTGKHSTYNCRTCPSACHRLYLAK